MSSPTVSIIIPVYNVEKYINQCFESILKQSFLDYEVIVIDDGSKDNSGEICDKYANKYKRFKVFHIENNGAGNARNYGLTLANGKFIFFIDADDWLEIDALKTHVKEIESFDMVIGCSKNCYFNKDTMVNSKVECYYPTNKYRTKDDVRKMYVDIAVNGVSHAPHNKLYKRSIIEENNIRFPNYKKYEDLTFNNEYIDKINSLNIINEVVYNYRVSDLQGIALKLPSDMFEIFTMVNDDLIKLLNQWNVMDEKSEKLLKSKYITDIASCINNSYNPNLTYRFIERYRYINKIINNEKVRDACKNVNSSLFVNCISKLVQIKSILLIMGCYKAKSLVKSLIKVRLL